MYSEFCIVYEFGRADMGIGVFAVLQNPALLVHDTVDAGSFAYVDSYVCHFNCYFAFTSFFLDWQAA